MGMPSQTAKPRPSLWPALDLPLRKAGTHAATHDASHAELQLSLARERVLREQAREFEHRFFNSLQMIVSLLATQSRSASPEVAAQLTIAINRIVAFGHVHRRLHMLDRSGTLQFGKFLRLLCTDLSGVFSSGSLAPAIVADSVELELPTALGGPLGFLVSELVTNSVKHGKGHVQVRLESASPSRYCLSVSDEGPGLPEGFDPSASSGLGMKIVRSLVETIGGEFHCSSGASDRGALFAVTFSSGAVEVEHAGVAMAKESPRF